MQVEKADRIRLIFPPLKLLPDPPDPPSQRTRNPHFTHNVFCTAPLINNFTYQYKCNKTAAYEQVCPHAAAKEERRRRNIHSLKLLDEMSWEILTRPE